MTTVEATFAVPPHIDAGLSTGRYERVGGVVRDHNTKRVVTWLREANETGEPVVSELLSVSSVTAAASVLNLAISTMGFAVMLNRLGVIEQQLQQSQVILEAIDYKIDLSFYAKFRAGLNLAINAFTMENIKNRHASALQAIERFLETEHFYMQLVDKEIANGSRVADEYLATLSLSYITEVRCYLELEELGTAQKRLTEGLKVLKPRYQKHVDTLLTSNPAAYLHPRLKDEIDLSRLTKIYRWIDPTIKNEKDVFELQRGNLFELAQKQNEWEESLPQAISIPKTANFLSNQSKKILGAIPKSLPGFRKQSTSVAEGESLIEGDIYSRLPETLLLIEQMIEDTNRLETYLAEVKVVKELKMGFEEWQQLAPSNNALRNESELSYITVSE